ncbi:DrmB family protein [Clostridium sp. B9]|uniref:DrmB family protein n=1 Tax=Clostridium sp. B9 TaxID=3423224 RepID=UPI003D2F0A31
MSKIQKTIPLNKNKYSLRFSQATSTYGTGAMVDFKEQTLMAAAPEFWKQSIEIHDERLESLLGVEKFCLPPDKDMLSGVPFVRFPQWYFCPRCKIFKSLKEWEQEYRPKRRGNQTEMITPMCSECNLQLVPAGIVVACEHGHIDDFPWREWVHDKSNKPCSKSLLRMRNTSSALGLEGLTIECVSCGAKATMRGAFNKDIFEQMQEKHKRRYKCSGNMPWKGKKEVCELYPRAIQRGALNIYFPKLVSSLVIPPYSDDFNDMVIASRMFKTLTDILEDSDYIEAVGRDKVIKKYVEKISKEILLEENITEVIVDRILNKEKSDNILSREEYRLQEYNALIGDIPKDCMNKRDFKIELISDLEKYNIPEISRVTLVKKLREVRALVGFSRIEPSDSNVISGFEEDAPKNFVSIKEKETNWYPAYETRGEGIFLEFDNSKIEEWVENSEAITHRISLVNERYNIKQRKLGNKERNITPKYVLLHTIAHLLIKELSFQCGYDSAALTERIYCNTEEQEENMSGILIYTSSGDSEGTLGGLVRQGRYDTLPKILRNSVRKAMWCSSDPVCIESLGQGRESLNLSACHACTLISETSCEEFNVLLDRALIVGTLEDKDIGFFSNMI